MAEDVQNGDEADGPKRDGPESWHKKILIRQTDILEQEKNLFAKHEDILERQTSIFNRQTAWLIGTAMIAFLGTAILVYQVFKLREQVEYQKRQLVEQGNQFQISHQEQKKQFRISQEKDKELILQQQLQISQHQWSDSYNDLIRSEMMFLGDKGDRLIALHSIKKRELADMHVVRDELAHVLFNTRILMRSERMGQNLKLDDSNYVKLVLSQEKSQKIYLVLLRKRLIFNTKIPDQIECHIREHPASEEVKKILVLIDQKIKEGGTDDFYISSKMVGKNRLRKISTKPLSCREWADLLEKKIGN